MEATATTNGDGLTPVPVKEEMVPIAANQRIEALDVVRGFALIGIFLMNIEFFNRTFGSFNEGMPRGLTGIDWLSSWFIAYFVQGKFWTIFSLLFGMGFAVMLVRAEKAGREFIQVYLRRIFALAVFGAAHYLFLWEGDILFSYAVGALCLIMVLYANTKQIVLAILATIAFGLIPGLSNFFGVAAGFAIVGLSAMYLRSEKLVNLRFTKLPIFSFLLLLIGSLMSVAAAVLWVLPNGPTDPRLPLSVFGPMLFIFGWLSWKYHLPVEKRSVRFAVALYVFFGASMLAGGLVQHFAPDPDAAVATPEKKAVDDKKASVPPAADKLASAPAKTTSASADAKPATPADVKPDAAAKADAKPAAKSDAKGDAKADPKKPKKTKEEQAAERKKEREKRLKENKLEKEKELKTFTKGTYREVVEWRGRRFMDKAAGDFGFAMVLIGMFLLGVWFVRSGVMENTGAHLEFFRKLAYIGLPIGIGMGLLASLIAMSHTPGDRYDGWGIARGLTTLGNLPACLGYVGAVVLMLHSKSFFAKISVLAPMGRMALTNYLMQSLICATYFYGYAMGQWGMPRGTQFFFVLAVFAAQVAFSHWWLSKFRYGPMEWYWRGYTYQKLPPFRI